MRCPCILSESIATAVPYFFLLIKILMLGLHIGLP